MANADTTDELSERELDDIEQRWANIRGTWGIYRLPHSDDLKIVSNDDGKPTVQTDIAFMYQHHGDHQADAEAIAHAPADITRLIAEVRRLRVSARQ